MERIAMSQEERDWLDWLKRVKDGVLTQRQAAQQMGISNHWVRKLRAYSRRRKGRMPQKLVEVQLVEPTLVDAEEAAGNCFMPERVTDLSLHGLRRSG
jgi:predicted DNA-binding protein (UPF0251 family)